METDCRRNGVGRRMFGVDVSDHAPCARGCKPLDHRRCRLACQTSSLMQSAHHPGDFRNRHAFVHGDSRLDVSGGLQGVPASQHPGEPQLCTVRRAPTNLQPVHAPQLVKGGRFSTDECVETFIVEEWSHLLGMLNAKRFEDEVVTFKAGG